jgi:hypothetical protein
MLIISHVWRDIGYIFKHRALRSHEEHSKFKFFKASCLSKFDMLALKVEAPLFITRFNARDMTSSRKRLLGARILVSFAGTLARNHNFLIVRSQAKMDA